VKSPPHRRITFLPKYEPHRVIIDGDRKYHTPSGVAAGVTTILSGTRDNTALKAWEAWKGEEEANAIRNTAAWRGNRVHEAVEFYLDHDRTEPEIKSWFVKSYWSSLRLFLPRIEQDLLGEGAIWHPEPSAFGGTFDRLAYLVDDGDQPSLLDWKTADNPIKPDKQYEYSLQVAAYVAGVNYVYGRMGLAVRRALIVVALPNREPQLIELTEGELHQLFRHFEARLQRYTFSRTSRTK